MGISWGALEVRSSRRFCMAYTGRALPEQGVGEFSVRRWNHRFEYVFQIYRFAHQRKARRQ